MTVPQGATKISLSEEVQVVRSVTRESPLDSLENIKDCTHTSEGLKLQSNPATFSGNPPQVLNIKADSAALALPLHPLIGSSSIEAPKHGDDRMDVDIAVGDDNMNKEGDHSEGPNVKGPFSELQEFQTGVGHKLDPQSSSFEVGTDAHGAEGPRPCQENPQPLPYGPSLVLGAGCDIRPLPPNYPPVIYPSTGSPRPTEALSCEKAGIDVGASLNQHAVANRDDNEDRTDNESDGSSEVSEGENLRGDLKSALEGDFDFRGSYAYSTVLPQAPNPCLYIDGLGLVGLPLSERDAKLIIGCSAQAPYGHGERTVVNTEVRDTWEVEPARVKFTNPAWSPFLENLAATTVWQALGVAPYSSRPRCELHKLLLYEAGSHFLPHQDSEKANGMFATIIIVLPSVYSGGQVHVSHSSSTQVFDLAPHSPFSTSLLAWYTDVMHEVKPVTSGYRLALSYNLIHTSAGAPRPSLPNMHTAIAGLRSVLRKWHKGAYDLDTDMELIAYLLKHQYSPANLRVGAAALKGEDAHKISHLRDLAEELGFMVGLANLSYNISGTADDYGGYEKRCRYDSYGSGEGSPSMMEVIETNINLDTLVDLDGELLLGTGELCISEEQLIPENPFEGVNPDDTEYEGYMGNESGTVDYFYRRTVLVLFREENEISILFSAGGRPYALKKLKRSVPGHPSGDDRKLASLILNEMPANDRETARAMAEFAINWNDLEMWKKVVKACGAEKKMEILGEDKFVEGWKAFSFERVRVVFEEMLSQSASLKTCLRFINSAASHASPEERETVTRWCEDQTTQALLSLKSPTKDDAPLLISIMLAKGATFISDVILPQLVTKTSIYDFWMAFIKALHDRKRTLLNARQPGETGGESQDQTNLSSSADAFDKIIQRCLDAVIKQWDSVVARPQVSYPYLHYSSTQTVPQQSKVSRVIELVELCLLTNHMTPCLKLLALILQSSGTSAVTFQTLYVPLIRDLRSFLKNKSIDISAHPFTGFIQLLISSYLRDILGSKLCKTPIQVRKIACRLNCPDCQSVDAFLCSVSAEETFRWSQARRTHVEIQLMAAKDLVTFTTIRRGSPHGLMVTKRPEVVATSQWVNRQNGARAFLKSIGDTATIKKIMGVRYADVLKALEGSQAFVLTVSATDYATASTSTTRATHARQPASMSQVIASASTSTPVPVPAQAASSSTVTGTKRKKSGPTIMGPVIDLTEDDSK